MSWTGGEVPLLAQSPFFSISEAASVPGSTGSNSPVRPRQLLEEMNPAQTDTIASPATNSGGLAERWRFGHQQAGRHRGRRGYWRAVGSGDDSCDVVSPETAAQGGHGEAAAKAERVCHQLRLRARGRLDGLWFHAGRRQTRTCTLEGTAALLSITEVCCATPQYCVCR